MRHLTVNLLLPRIAVLSLAILGFFSAFEARTDVTVQNVLRGASQSAYEASFRDSNPIKSIAISAVASIKYAILREGRSGVVVGRQGWLFTAEEMEVSANFDANIERSADRIARVQHRLNAIGVVLLPVLVPDKVEFYSKHLHRTRPHSVVTRRDTVLAALAERGIAPLDAARALEIAQLEGPIFLRDDTHWTPHGAKAVAAAIGQALAGAEFTRSEVQTRHTGFQPVDGDLLTFVPTDRFRGIVGPAQSTIPTYATHVTSEGGLFGDASVDVTLVGTSFTARRDLHFLGFVKAALQADVLDMARAGQGPFAPMEAYLASEAFAASRPKVVIWEIPVRYLSKDPI